MQSNQMQYRIKYTPENAIDKEIIWSVENITGEAEIDQKGLVTAHQLGEIKVIATLKSNPLINTHMLVSIRKRGIILRTKDGKILRDKNTMILLVE